MCIFYLLLILDSFRTPLLTSLNLSYRLDTILFDTLHILALQSLYKQLHIDVNSITHADSYSKQYLMYICPMSTAKFMHMYVHMWNSLVSFGYPPFFRTFLVIPVVVAAVVLSRQLKSLNFSGLYRATNTKRGKKTLQQFLLDFACRIGNGLQLVFGLVVVFPLILPLFEVCWPFANGFFNYTNDIQKEFVEMPECSRKKATRKKGTHGGHFVVSHMHVATLLTCSISLSPSAYLFE